MKNLSKKIVVAGVVALTLMPILGLAQFQTQGAPTLPTENLTYGRVIAIIDNIANVMFGILVALSVFVVLWAAWLYLGVGGKQDPEAAKTMLVYAVIAIAVGLLAKLLPQVVYILIGVRPQ